MLNVAAHCPGSFSSRRRGGRRLLRTHRLRVAVLAAVALIASIGLVTGCTSGISLPVPLPSPPTSHGPGASVDRPNIVFVLTDDLSWNLVSYMPHVLSLEHQGMTFVNYTVTDSLCCPSRASIFTGEFPHDTHVLGNTMPLGGFLKFKQLGEEQHTFATAAAAAGYRTALYGKYLNQYRPASPGAEDGSSAYVPPGWTNWGGIDEGGYRGYDYSMGIDHTVHNYGTSPQDYATTQIEGLGSDFALESMKAGDPFLLELATFAPHKPYVPAPQDVGTFTGLKAPRPASYGRLPTDPPAWMVNFPPISTVEQARIDNGFERRVESVQAVDRMIGDFERLLASHHQLDKTVFVFSSDNGFHMGEHDLRPGKQTAFDTDIRVPLIVAGPGIPADTVSTAVVENIDLAPTFEELTGAATPPENEGRSIVPLLHGENPPWRSLALIEHTYDKAQPGDPDSQTADQGDPPSYDAIRTPYMTFVRYRVSGRHEYYDLRTDPEELHNAIGSLSPARIAQLDGWLNTLTSCHDAAACWQAGRPAPIAP